MCIRDRGNDGIAAFVQRLPGAIGYVEYAYAKQNNLAYTCLLYTSVDPLDSTSRQLDPLVVGQEHYDLSLIHI